MYISYEGPTEKVIPMEDSGFLMDGQLQTAKYQSATSSLFLFPQRRNFTNAIDQCYVRLVANSRK